MFHRLAPAPPPATPAGASYRLQWGLRIPMRDGVALNATFYLPPAATAPLPAVVTITPYIADSYHARGSRFARAGYAFLSVDHRGRGNSEGEFEPFAGMGDDGYDVVEWIAAQPWCDGHVAMWGGSYAGQNQWATLKMRPPHLRTIVPAAAVHCGIDFPGTSNIAYSYNIQWLTFTAGRTGNTQLFQDNDFWLGSFHALAHSGAPFATLDALVGHPSASFQTWLAHPEGLRYWQAELPTPADYAAIDVPILTITGHFDGDQPGALHFYRQHMQHGQPAACANHYLVIGPWDHAGTRTPTKTVGGLTFGDAALVDLDALHSAWYGWTLRGGERPAWLKQRVAYFVVGPDEWRYADSLEAIGAQPRRFYLHAAAAGIGGSVFRSANLIDAAADGADLNYLYDPCDLRHTASELKPREDYLLDASAAMQIDGDGLVFHSAPLAVAQTLVGWPRLVAWLRLDVPDTDFRAALYEITADGRSIALGDALLRARYRHSLTEPQLVTPGTLEAYTFDTFLWTARELAAGSRLRLTLRAPNTIHLQRNYNSGGAVASETPADARTAHVTLVSDRAHPSYLELPLLPQPAAGGVA